MKHSRSHIVLAVLCGALATACTVQPLYAPGAGLESGTRSGLQSVSIAAANNRVAIEVRNHLIFLLNGGSGQPANPLYELSLKADPQLKSALIYQTPGRDGEPTSRTVTVAASYVLRKTEGDAVISTRRASASASFDVSQQEFANLRAKRDAENRAASEVAEMLRALIAADIARAEAG
jgi:LPS-assembly lipoprotein